jgi:hypothetical protein
MNPTPIPGDRGGAGRYFYAAATALVLVLTVLGFHHFYFEGRAYPGRPITPPIRGLVIAHGLAMSAWLVLGVVQPLLVARRHVQLHMKLGLAAATLAATLVPFGILIALRSTPLAAPEAFGAVTPRQFLAEPLLIIVGFGALVALGLAKRRHAPAHRACMFLATLMISSAGTGRMDPVVQSYAGTVLFRLFGDMLPTLVLGAGLLAAQRVITGRIDRWFAGGLAALAAWFCFIQQAMTSAWWARAADWLLA